MSVETRVDVHNQVLLASIPIAGTPLRLNYSSDRVAGRRSAYAAVVSLPRQPNGSLAGIEAELHVAGRTIAARLHRDQASEVELRWDGLDADGRPVQGRQRALVRTRPIRSGLLSSLHAPDWHQQEVTLGAWDARHAGLGGWTLTAHHAYDRAGRVVYYGTGRRRRVPENRPASEDAAGRWSCPTSDGRRVDVFDATGRHLDSCHGLTGAVLWRAEYDGDGRLSALVDGDGNATRIHRADDGAPLGIIAAFGHSTGLRTGADGHLTAVIDPMGQTVRCEYSEGGLLVGIASAGGHHSRFAYDEDGRLHRTEPAGGGAVMLARARTANGYRVALFTELNKEYGYEAQAPARGVRRRTTNCCGARPFIEDVTGAGVRSAVYPDGLTVEARHEPDPRLGPPAALLSEALVTTPNGRRMSLSVSRSALAGKADKPFDVQVERVTVNAKTYVTIRTAIEDGHLVSTTTPCGTTTTARVDARGRLREVAKDALAPTRYRYDEHGRLVRVTVGVGHEVRETAIDYDGGGNLARITAPDGRSMRFATDAAGRVTRQSHDDGRVVEYGYDEDGRLSWLRPPSGQAHRFTYEPDGLLATRQTPPVDGIPELTAYRYDGERRLTSIHEPDGTELDLVYGTGGRLTQVVAGPATIRHAYDEATGRRRRTSGPGAVTLSYEYDGPLLVGEAWAGEVEGRVERDYDDDLRLIRLTVDREAPVEFDYDDDGRLVRAGELVLEPRATDGAERWELGTLAGERRFNAFGELTHERLARGGELLYGVDYLRDGAGRLVERRERLNEETTTVRYAYDPAGRLAEVVRDGRMVARYRYDDNGNRLSAEIRGSRLEARYDARDRLTAHGADAYAYAAAGRRITRTTGGTATENVYDKLGNLTSVRLAGERRIEYVCDGRGRRVGKKLDGARTKAWLYQDGLRVAAERDDRDGVMRRFVYTSGRTAPDLMIAGGSAYVIVADQVGSPRIVVAADTGAVVQELDYDAFGVVVRDTNPGFQPFGFAGGLYDGDTGLLRFGRRDYDPAVGRWLTEDPAGYRGGDTNLYGYAFSDPVNRSDPKGLWEWPDWVDPRTWTMPDSAGFSVEVDMITPLFSGGGGAGGLNFQWFPGGGWLPKVFVYGPSATCDADGQCTGTPSEGFSVGVGCQFNAAWGTGDWTDWTGDFDNYAGNFGPAGGSHFESPGANPPYEGVSVNLPGAGVSAPAGFSPGYRTTYYCIANCD